MSAKDSKIILGIDPGTVVMGYGIIHVNTAGIKLLSMGVVQLSKYGDSVKKLRVISEKVTGLIHQYQPEECAIEAPFFGRNVQSMLKLGRAQGVAIAAALIQGVEVFEYSPKKIKQSVTGNGNASKEQVAAMLQRLCHFTLQPKFLDATDALSAAVCHYLQKRSVHSQKQGKRYSGWKEFIAANPSKRLS
ncbi:MAG: crossover junction endodeoxyribonuclease RuvC [Chitinophagales bacterium]|nr:crossover junction endodeoxyribonuclease RuvC [Chitinophagales bacterium]MDW8273754.1 crossover junction endodeoxyribonuclease RuvC [Chitinophagales bacterium]